MLLVKQQLRTYIAWALAVFLLPRGIHLGYSASRRQTARYRIGVWFEGSVDDTVLMQPHPRLDFLNASILVFIPPGIR